MLYLGNLYSLIIALLDKVNSMSPEVSTPQPRGHTRGHACTHLHPHRYMHVHMHTRAHAYMPGPALWASSRLIIMLHTSRSKLNSAAVVST